MTGVSFEQVQQDFANGLVTLGTSNSEGKLLSDLSLTAGPRTED